MRITLSDGREIRINCFVGYFYEQQDAMDAFDARIAHVMNHKHKTLGKAWKELPEYIFAFEVRSLASLICEFSHLYAGPERGDDRKVRIHESTY